MRSIINLIIILSSIISFCVILINFEKIPAGYELIVLLPIFFSAIYLIIFNKLFNKGYNFTLLGSLIMQWIRFVIIPILISLSEGKPGFDYLITSPNTLRLSIILMIYELIATSIVLLLFFSKMSSKKILQRFSDSKISTLKGNLFIYFIFILISFYVLFTIGIPNNLVRFLYISIQDGAGQRVGDAEGSKLVLIQQIITIGGFTLFLFVANAMYKLYKKKPDIKYYYITLFVALYNLSIIIGERRTAQIYIAAVSIYLLINLFPQYYKKTVIYILTMAGTILLFMSIYKFFGAFMSGSYLSAVSNANKDFSFWSRTFQSYFFGPENISSVIEFAKVQQLSFSNFIFDNARSIFGLNFFVNKDNLVTSQIYNSYIYQGKQLSGHVISSIAYGTIFFGAYFSPIIACFNIIISMFFEYCAKATKSLELKFLFIYLLIRFSTNLYVNTPALMNFITIFIGTAGLLFITALIFRTSKQREE